MNALTVFISFGFVFSSAMAYRYQRLYSQLSGDIARAENVRYLDSLEKVNESDREFGETVREDMYQLLVKVGQLEGENIKLNLQVKALEDYIDKYQGGVGSARSQGIYNRNTDTIMDPVPDQLITEEKPVTEPVETVENPIAGTSLEVHASTKKFMPADGIPKKKKEQICYYQYRLKVDEIVNERNEKPTKEEADAIRAEIAEQFGATTGTVKTYISSFQKKLKGLKVAMNCENGIVLDCEALLLDNFGNHPEFPDCHPMEWHGRPYTVETQDDGQIWIMPT